MRHAIAVLTLIGNLAAAKIGDGDAPLTVTGRVAISGGVRDKTTNGDAVIWLKSMGAEASLPLAPRQRVIQRHKRFDPHLLVVPVGTIVDFPNLDPFFHNVFSLFDGKRFDLGLYEAGASRSVTFSRAGVSFIFCNIHPEMSAVVVAVDSPYYAVSSRSGEFQLTGVPAGRYLLSVWHERAKPASLADAPREVTISSESSTLGVLRLVESGVVIAPHKNKYGKEYDAPPPSAPIYR